VVARVYVFSGERTLTALGCTVGVLLSGIHAGSLSGWIFLIAMSIGILASWQVSRLFSHRRRGLAAPVA